MISILPSCSAPVTSSIVFASTIPSLLTTPSRISSAALVVKYTSPPSAIIASLFSTKASNSPFVTLRLTRELPFKLRLNSFPPLRLTDPNLALITPSFTASLANKAA